MRRLLLVATLAWQLAACGQAATQPSPTPLVPFPAADTPLSQTSGAEHDLWSAYQVTTVPGVHALEHVPAVTHVTNATFGAVPDQMAQEWAAALFRDAGWRQWAYLHAQANFIGHIDGQAADTSNPSRGVVVQYPDCWLFPTALALIPVPADESGNVSGSDQWEWLTTYTAPAAGCIVNDLFPDGHTEVDDQFSGSRTLVEPGWLHEDPILGQLWIDDNRQNCADQCPVPVVFKGTPPPFPGEEIPLAQGTAQQRSVWTSYAVALLPRDGIGTQTPKLPEVDNQTNGAISQTLAQRWARALFQDQAWLKWAQEHDQKDFVQHIGDSSLLNQDLSTDAQRGGIPTMPDCAVYPTSLKLAVIGDADRHGGGSTATQSDQFVFTETFASPCTIPVAFTDGTSDKVSVPHQLASYGSVRQDPLLGEIWYPDAVAPPPNALGV